MPQVAQTEITTSPSWLPGSGPAPGVQSGGGNGRIVCRCARSPSALVVMELSREPRRIRVRLRVLPISGLVAGDRVPRVSVRRSVSGRLRAGRATASRSQDGRSHADVAFGQDRPQHDHARWSGSCSPHGSRAHAARTPRPPDSGSTLIPCAGVGVAASGRTRHRAPSDQAAQLGPGAARVPRHANASARSWSSWAGHASTRISHFCRGGR